MLGVEEDGAAVAEVLGVLLRVGEGETRVGVNDEEADAARLKLGRQPVDLRGEGIGDRAVVEDEEDDVGAGGGFFERALFVTKDVAEFQRGRRDRQHGECEREQRGQRAAPGPARGDFPRWSGRRFHLGR